MNTQGQGRHATDHTHYNTACMWFGVRAWVWFGIIMLKTNKQKPGNSDLRGRSHAHLSHSCKRSHSHKALEVRDAAFLKKTDFVIHIFITMGWSRLLHSSSINGPDQCKKCVAVHYLYDKMLPFQWCHVAKNEKTHPPVLDYNTYFIIFWLRGWVWPLAMSSILHKEGFPHVCQQMSGVCLQSRKLQREERTETRCRPHCLWLWWRNSAVKTFTAFTCVNE